MSPEFSRIERVDSIGGEPRTITVEADADERRRLAGRFGLIAVERLAARFTVHRDSTGLIAEGRVEATVTQACSVTGDPIAATVDEAITLRFVEAAASGEEIELSDDAIDTIEIEGGAIDLGEVAAETMALALDPFPRSAGAAEALRAAGVVGEENAGAFGALAGLKDKLGRG